MIILLYLIYIC